MRRLAVVLTVLVATGVVAWILRTPEQTELQLFAGEPVAVVAHRGGAGVAPENTMLAFERAVALGVDGLELDLHLSADGHIVVIHDPTVDRTTDGTGRVSDLTLAELQTLDAGYAFAAADGTFPYRGQGLTIPTLDEVLSAFPNLPVNMEIKPDTDGRLVPALAELLQDHDALDRVVVTSFDGALLRDFRDRLPGVATNLGADELRVFYVLQRLKLHGWYRPPGEMLMIPEVYGDLRLVTPGLLDAASSLGLSVHVWTVNEPDDMRRLMAMDIDGIITDYPGRLQDVIASETVSE
ncbi:MAG: glycerophosphodiester phosphodiesterase [Trueperaceae bacterium]|nr:glycerophosphodiester phosphodiesterase [Trueperaceae bacterium]